MIFEVKQRGGWSEIRADQVSRIVHAPANEGHSAGSFIFMLDGRYEAVEERPREVRERWLAALAEWVAATRPTIQVFDTDAEEVDEEWVQLKQQRQ